MLVMQEPVLDKGLTIKTNAKVQRALDHVVASLKASDRVRWRGGRATKEAVVNASWLWLEALGDEAVEDAMAEFIPKLEKLLEIYNENESRDLTGLGEKIIHEANRPKKAGRGPLITDVDNLTPRRPGDRRGKKGA
jgi:hypothetical protein